MSTDAKALEAEIVVEVGRGASRFSVTAKLALERGVLVLFGPSGCGKSLTLRSIVGVVTPREGTIAVAGERVFDSQQNLFVPAHRRRIGFVPQHHSLFPFCNVRDNVVFGLPRSERGPGNERVERLMDELGIAHLRESMPRSLSGGERQRVALARALAVEPKLLVLDEPFASIDQTGRDELRETLLTVLARHDTPAVFVTHDPVEAVVVGDEMALYERGRSVQLGRPRDLLPEAQRFVVQWNAARAEERS
jgi:molybdate transport system ATP-binding protein